MKKSLPRRFGIFAVVAAALTLALLLPGCVSAGLAVFGAGTGVAMGVGTDYTLNGVAYKTFTATIDEVAVASRNGLDNMGIQVVADGPGDKPDKGWRIEGVANSRRISIDLQALAPKTTRIRVVAEDGIFFKDKATEAEIIAQMSDALESLAVATHEPTEAPGRAATTTSDAENSMQLPTGSALQSDSRSPGTSTRSSPDGVSAAGRNVGSSAAADSGARGRSKGAHYK